VTKQQRYAYKTGPFLPTSVPATKQFARKQVSFLGHTLTTAPRSAQNPHIFTSTQNCVHKEHSRISLMPFLTSFSWCLSFLQEFRLPCLLKWLPFCPDICHSLSQLAHTSRTLHVLTDVSQYSSVYTSNAIRITFLCSACFNIFISQ
jgi:hypothetical protein